MLHTFVFEAGLPLKFRFITSDSVCKLSSLHVCLLFLRDK